jgi:5-hydroxyisourate hydrolase
MITTHVLDTALGKPASGIGVTLYFQDSAGWRSIGQGVTDADGRLRTLTSGPIASGTYKLVFETSSRSPFFPEVAIVFKADAGAHYHVPLLLSPFGYSTYRGS